MVNDAVNAAALLVAALLCAWIIQQSWLAYGAAATVAECMTVYTEQGVSAAVVKEWCR